MTRRRPARTATRRTPGILVAGLLVISAVLIASLGYQRLTSASLTRPSLASPFPATGWRAAAPPSGVLGGAHRGGLGEADGVVPDGTTVFHDDIPAVANLHPALLDALRHAAADAAQVGVEFHVNSGWRSPQYQNRLLGQAVVEYGSEAEAARWVATAETSPHVSGNAVDIGPDDATAWLSENGADYGLCQIYGNEPWHYEIRPEAIDHSCPPMYADPTQDPRMRQ
jgi:zinc D-Ala-D-Ala carboxypeptidase